MESATSIFEDVSAISDDVTNNYTDNVTSHPSEVSENDHMADDAIWILTSTFIIFTMQSGFGLLESGSVSTKNEVNIMVKNAVDVIVGGLAFWMFGYAFGFGTGEYSNSFCGWGYFFVTAKKEEMGYIYSKFFFQASFATTATTIVSGAMAERTKLEAYIVFSFLNTLIFCFPAHWVWAENGWLAEQGFVDIAGCGPVHLVGGVTGLVATLVLKPRHGRFESKYAPQMGSPTNALLGMFMLWWGWLGFNCGSTFGISGFKWKLAARSAISTLNASVSGGLVALVSRSAITTFISSVAGGLFSVIASYIFEKRKFDVSYLINGILGALVGVTALCALAEPWEGVVIGCVGASLSLAFCKLEEKLKIDDPVGCVGVHAIAGMWGLLSVGLFAKEDRLKSAISLTKDIPGLFYGGGGYLLGIQLAGVTALCVWTAFWAYVMLKLIDVTIGLRISTEHELLGADLVEHGVGDVDYDKSTNTVIGLKSESPGTEQELKIKYGKTIDADQINAHIQDHLSNRRRSLLGHCHNFQESRRRIVRRNSQNSMRTESDTNLDMDVAEHEHPVSNGKVVTKQSHDNTVSTRRSSRLRDHKTSEQNGHDVGSGLSTEQRNLANGVTTVNNGVGGVEVGLTHIAEYDNEAFVANGTYPDTAESTNNTNQASVTEPTSNGSILFI